MRLDELNQKPTNETFICLCGRMKKIRECLHWISGDVFTYHCNGCGKGRRMKARRVQGIGGRTVWEVSPGPWH